MKTVWESSDIELNRASTLKKAVINKFKELKETMS